jgi:2-polyprenyl-3-methyl-5-hydroxy-6-metoxy-1,4-benzoquinol methylase
MQQGEFQAMLDQNERHWWYRGRSRIVRAELDRLALAPGLRILDAGCSSGAMLEELERFGETWGAELNPAGVAAARRRGCDRIVRARVEELPFASASFDLVTCLDVIEHTPDDRASLAELHRVTAPGGHLLVTVPAYPALWSHHDVVNCHYRRYVGRTLIEAASAAGWAPVRTTHFNASFLAPAALVRLVMRGEGERQRRSELALTPRALDGVLELPLRLEAALLRRGVRLPAGLSLLAVFERPVPAAHRVTAATPRLVPRAEPVPQSAVAAG